MLLTSELNHLESTELVRRLLEPDVAYLFKHALVQDTARASLLLHERRRLHRLVGDALEALYPEQRAELASLLAQHFSSAGDDAKTLEYATLAGDGSARIYAHAEAIAQYTLALDAGQKTGAPVQQLYLKRGRVQELSGNFEAALKTYAEMAEVGRARGDKELELASMSASATIYSIPSTSYNARLADQLSAQALDLARTLGNKAAEATILWNLLLLHSRVGAGFAQAVTYGEEALQIARDYNLTERLAYILNDLSPLLVFQGQPERAAQYNLESRAMWIQLGNLPMLGGNYGYAVMNNLMAGNYQQAIDDAAEGLRISREINNAWNEAFSQAWIGEAYLEFGEIAQAEQVMLAAIELGERTFPPTLVITRSDLTRLYADLGQPERAIELGKLALQVAEQRFVSLRSVVVGALGHAYLQAGQPDHARELLRGVPDLFNSSNNPRYASEATGAQAELALVEGENDRALGLIEGLLKFYRANKMRQHLPGILLLNARALATKGETESALAILEQARAEADSMNARWSLWQIHAALCRLHTARGDAESAGHARTQAIALVEYIAARTPADLRDTFLQTVAI